MLISEQYSSSKLGINEIFCLLLPLEEVHIIVPSLIVAEVSLDLEISNYKPSLDWFLGYANWREHQLPIFSFELANGNIDEVNATGKFKRVAIFRGISDIGALPFYAFPISDIPHVNRYSSGDMVTLSYDPGILSLAAIEVQNSVAIIPNIEYIENCILNSLSYDG